MNRVAKNRYLRNLGDHYVKIGNMNIIIQPEAETLDLVNKYLGDTKNQVIHIFEIYPVSIPNLLSAICESVDHGTKIFIHIPKMLKDYIKLVRPKIDKLERRVKFVIDSKEVVFKYYDKYFHYPKYFKISFDSDYYNFYIHVFKDFKTCALPRTQYDYDKNGSVKTEPQRKYPELFRDEIIKNFKKNNPKGIVKTFKDDDEIWEFLIENGKIHINTEEEEDDKISVLIDGEEETI